MDNCFKDDEFENINRAYKDIFKPNRLSIGLVVPIESYSHSSIPTMKQHIQMIELVENLGFKAVWLRDIPYNVPSFGDVGQMFDPFVYLGFLSSVTTKIALGIGSIILPLRHPAHIAKSAASIDVLSNVRLILGVASGDRYEEYPALNIPYEDRGERFRQSFEYIKKAWEIRPRFNNSFGEINNSLDMLPKPTNKKVPMIITGSSQQNQEWLTNNGDGWITYPRNPQLQGRIIEQLRKNAKDKKQFNKPVSQSLYIDLVEDFEKSPQEIHLGYRLNVEQLKKHLKQLELVGVNHVALNLRFNKADIKQTLNLLAEELLPSFS